MIYLIYVGMDTSLSSNDSFMVVDDGDSEMDRILEELSSLLRKPSRGRTAGILAPIIYLTYIEY